MNTFLSFLAVAAVAVAVPGPDTFVVLRTSLAEGARAGTWAAAGSAAGNLVWARPRCSASPHCSTPPPPRSRR